jgi:uncharacterized protein YbaP (TraB family)
LTDADDSILVTRRAPLIVLGVGAALALAAIIGVVVILTGPSGEESPAESDVRAIADEACPSVTVPHLYRVTSKTSATSYLLATRHAGVPLSRFPAAVDAALREARVLVVESLLPDDAGIRRDTAPTGSAPATGSVADQLGDALWDKYEKLVGRDIAARVKHLTPVAATAALALLYEDTSRSIDREVQTIARAQHKPIVPLEVDDEHGEHLTEEYLGIDSLRAAIKEIPSRGVLARFVRASLAEYCTGTVDPRFADSGRYDAVTNRRTRAWITAIVDEVSRGNAFIAVGSNHVEGRVNLRDLLRDRGFAVDAAP